MKEFEKEIAWRIKRDSERVNNIKRGNSIKDRLKKLSNETATLNITKQELPELKHEIGDDGILRLIYLVQNSIDVNLGLCEGFRIFYSNKNKKFHKICMYTSGKVRALCNGDITNCNLGFFDDTLNQIKKPERKVKKIKFDKL